MELLPIVLPGSEQFEDFTAKQLKIFWLPTEVNVEKDIQDVLTNFTKSEKHGVITTLKLFSMYEIAAGEEFWGGRFKKIFAGDMAALRMASVFAMFENAIHQPFYNKINELLHINNPEFYKSYLDNPVLKSRMEFIGSYIDHEDDLVSLGVFSMVEGVILYSNFGYLKHFQSQGKNKLLNFVRGINFSLRDENLHSIAGAFAFKYKLSRANLNEEQWIALVEKIHTAAHKMYEHEVEIIKMIFEEGTIEGITKTQLIHFVESRINECLIELGIKPLFDVKSNPIAEWFYKAINDYSFNDNFSGISNQYHRNWDESRFGYKKAETKLEEIQ